MTQEKSHISSYHGQREKELKQKLRLGPLTGFVGFILIMSFSLFYLPFFLFMLFFNYTYFWVRKEKPLNPGDYIHFDRHRIAHLGFLDRVWCEYCEWANGGMQWAAAIISEIERRYCPIQNKCCPHCPKVKEWRKNFLPYDHDLDDLKRFFKKGIYEDASIVEKDKEG